MSGGEPNPLWPRPAQGLEPFQREREVRAALGRHERVDLVDDDGIDRGERAPGIRSQQQIQRLRCGDENVRGVPQESSALGLRGIAGPNGDSRHDARFGSAFRHLRDAHQRRSQVALDVDGQRFEGRHVEHAAAPLAVGRRLEHQSVQAREKRGECLAASGRGEHERRVAARDDGPCEGLRTSRRGERRFEPRAYSGMKLSERVFVGTD